MKITRRLFNFHTALALMSFSLRAKAHAKTTKSDKYTGLFILQGATDETSTRISVMTKKNQALEFTVTSRSSGELILPMSEEIFEKTYADWQVHNFYFTQLELSEQYDFVAKDSSGAVVDQRSFGLLDSQTAQYSFVLASCMDDKKHVDWIWKNLSAQNPNVLFLIGDMVYADQVGSTGVHPADEAQLWQRYTETRSILELYRFAKLIPTFAVWDDHDTGKNNSDRDCASLPLAHDIFDMFFPMGTGSSNLQRGPGQAKWVKLFGQNFVLMDGRSFRSPKNAVDETLFGVDQENWLFANLVAGEKHWLVAGTEWFSMYPNNETYIVTHPNSFKTFMARLKDSQAVCVFASGDVHFSEICRVPKEYLGYESYEFVSSSMHSSFVPGMDKFLTNKNRIFSKAFRNFLIFRGLTTSTSAIEGSVEVLSADEKAAYIFDYLV